jgi:hypothetical protein
MPSIFRGSDGFDTAGGNAVKAWVNFNGTGTVAIRASYNVSSITDNGTGDYTVNFTTALPDANYAVVGSGHSAGFLRQSIVFGRTGSYTTTSIVIWTGNTITGGEFDLDTINVSIFR